ncbi:MAG: hypothetical protein WBN72_08745 [Nitrososphaeraceae archaeon]
MKLKKIIPYPFYNSDSPLLSDIDKNLNIFLNKPFWIWDQQEHNIQFIKTNGKCCHVDILGRPQKNGIDFPIFDYQKLIFDAIENNMNVWILKARGIGLTTFIIYYLTWKILSSHGLDHESIFIISGTREAHANYIKEKMAKLFERNFPLLNIYTKYTELVLKNTWIKVFPTTAVKDLRGYFSAKYIFVDESDYFPESVQDELIHAITPYQTKSNCKIILSSTPFKPLGLMQRIEQDPNSKYFKLRLHYQLGLDKIYNAKEIELRKQDIEFKREFELQYLGKTGNVFTPQQVDNCINLGLEFSTDKIPVSLYTLKSVGVDFGFSSSSTAIVTLEHIKTDKDIIRVVDCHLIDKGDPNLIVNLCWDIWQRHNFMNTAYWIDGSNRAMVNLLKIRWQESLSWEWESNDSFDDTTRIRPVNFNTDHKTMLSNLHAVISKGYLAIDPKYDKLLISLRTAYANELSLDKDQTSYSDLLDGLRLGLKAYQISN